jgi:hypothetical protein
LVKEERKQICTYTIHFFDNVFDYDGYAESVVFAEHFLSDVLEHDGGGLGIKS